MNSIAKTYLLGWAVYGFQKRWTHQRDGALLVDRCFSSLANAGIYVNPFLHPFVLIINMREAELALRGTPIEHNDSAYFI